MANLDEARKTYQATLKEESKKGKSVIAETFKELLPEGFYLRWTQSTPSFNDGDPCEFGVGDPSIGKASKKHERAENEDTEEISEYSSCEEIEGITKTQVKEIFKAFAALQKQEDFLEGVFGDGSEILIFSDGHVVREDYYEG